MCKPFIALTLISVSLIAYFKVAAQREPDQVFMKNIRTTQLIRTGDQLAYPVISLGSSGSMQLDFDDLDGDVKYYYFTFEMRNADWSPVQTGFFDYVKGFTSQRITNYRFSSLILSRYTHYQVKFPDQNMVPTRSGNFVLKVFLDGDTSRLAFTKRFLVVEPGISVAAQIVQPFSQQYFNKSQKIQLVLNSGALNVSYPQQQVKVVILQNYRWDNCIHNIIPSIVRGNNYEYNSESDCVMPAGKEWRWLNLRSFRLLSDRVRRQENTNTAYELFVVPDGPRPSQRYYFYTDYNGRYFLDNTDNMNPYWNGDYATIHFTFVPPENIPYTNEELYLFGEITNYGKEDNARMQWNDEKKLYETTLYLKQGYYDYAYALLNPYDKQPKFDLAMTEGNTWETENEYLVLAYYRELGGRFDRLMGMAKLNSMLNRPGQ